MSLAFGTAGIRGLYGEELGAKEALRIAFGVVEAQGEGSYAVGYDGRRSSQLLARVARALISWRGCEVLSLGLLPTPALAFNSRRFGVRAGLACTASHNPPEFCGIKVYDGRGVEAPISMEERIGEGMRRYREPLGAESLPPIPTSKRFGAIREVEEEGLAAYLEALKARVGPSSKGAKVVVDAGNGAAARALPKLLSSLGHRVLSLNAHQSHTFPGRSPEPTASSLGLTAKVVRLLGADLGVALDGDGDRVVLLTRDGRVIEDYVLSYLFLQLLSEERGKGGCVVLSVNTSKAVEELALGLGLRVVRSRLGKVGEKVMVEGAFFGTEPSKLIDSSWGPWEDGLLGAALLAKEAGEGRLEERLEGVPRYHWRQVNLPLQGIERSRLREALLKGFSLPRLKEVEELDGVKFVDEEGDWILFRVSGTEPKIRIYAEAKVEGKVEGLIAMGKAFVEGLRFD